jgi:hypothetical protein
VAKAPPIATWSLPRLRLFSTPLIGQLGALWRNKAPNVTVSHDRRCIHCESVFPNDGCPIPGAGVSASALDAIPAHRGVDSSLSRTGRPERLSFVLRLELLSSRGSDWTSLVCRWRVGFDIDVCRCVVRVETKALRSRCVGCHNVLSLGIGRTW